MLFQWLQEKNIVDIRKREELVTRAQCYFSLESPASEILYNGRFLCSMSHSITEVFHRTEYLSVKIDINMNTSCRMIIHRHADSNRTRRTNIELLFELLEIRNSIVRF